MRDRPQGGPLVDESAETYCYNHTDTPTKLRCTRCDRPICGRCAIPASVGQHCPECVADARRSAPRVRSAIRATAPAVTVILVINIAIWIAQSFLLPVITGRFAAYPPAIAGGELWRLISPMFLHLPFNPGNTFSLLHIGFNSYVLYAYGPHVEQAFGTARFVAMYLVAGFVASATSYTFGACGVPSLGASGAIFGVVGILIAYLYRRRTSAILAGYLRSMMIFVALNLLIGFTIAGIDNFAHIGGLIGGVLLGAGMEGTGGRARPAGAQIAVIAGVAVLGAALVVWRTATFVCGAV
jgi:membrane associated rhomboid family serine protease